MAYNFQAGGGWDPRFAALSPRTAQPRAEGLLTEEEKLALRRKMLGNIGLGGAADWASGLGNKLADTRSQVRNSVMDSLGVGGLAEEGAALKTAAKSGATKALGAL